MQIKILELYNKLKENYGMIAIIVSFLGGIWQLIQLSIISPQLIRFFSISQLVADGLLITLLIFISSFPLVIFLFAGYEAYYVGSKKEENIKNIFRFILFVLMVFLGFDLLFRNDLSTMIRLSGFIYYFNTIVITVFLSLEVFLKKKLNRNIMLSLLFGFNISLALYTFFSIHLLARKKISFHTFSLLRAKK